MGFKGVYIARTCFPDVGTIFFQLKREPKPYPKLNIKRKVENIDDFTMEDFEIVGYQPHPKIAMDMAV